MVDQEQKKSTSDLEKELSRLLAETEEGHLERVREVIRELAITPERRVIVTSYPACNSGS